MQQIKKLMVSTFFACAMASTTFFGANLAADSAIGNQEENSNVVHGGGHHGGGHHHGGHHHGGHHHGGHHHGGHHGGHHGHHHHHGDHHNWNHHGWGHQGNYHQGYWNSGSVEWNGNPGYYYDPNYYYSGSSAPSVPYVTPSTTIYETVPSGSTTIVPVTPPNR